MNIHGRSETAARHQSLDSLDGWLARNLCQSFLMRMNGNAADQFVAPQQRGNIYELHNRTARINTSACLFPRRHVADMKNVSRGWNCADNRRAFCGGGLRHNKSLCEELNIAKVNCGEWAELWEGSDRVCLETFFFSAFIPLNPSIAQL